MWLNEMVAQSMFIEKVRKQRLELEVSVNIKHMNVY